MFAAIASFHTALMALCFLSSATLRRKDVRLDAVQLPVMAQPLPRSDAMI